MSLTLFKKYLQRATLDWIRKYSRRENILAGNESIYTLLFSDDQVPVIIAQEFEDMEYMLRKLLQEYEIKGTGTPHILSRVYCTISNLRETCFYKQ